MTTYIDIIDTAVKIGLGAAISGITTFFITKRLHKQDMSNKVREERHDLLRSIASNLESSSAHMNTGVGAFRNFDKELASSEYLKAAMKNSEAKALAGLLGLEDVRDQLGKIHDYLDETSLELSKEHPDLDKCNQFNTSISAGRECIYTSMANEFARL